MKRIGRGGEVVWGALAPGRGPVMDIFREEAPATLGSDGESCWYVKKGTRSNRKEFDAMTVLLPSGSGYRPPMPMRMRAPRGES